MKENMLCIIEKATEGVISYNIPPLWSNKQFFKNSIERISMGIKYVVSVVNPCFNTVQKQLKLMRNVVLSN